MKTIIIRIIALIVSLFLNRKEKELEVDKPKEQESIRKAGAKRIKKPPTLPLLGLFCIIFITGCQSSHKIIIVDREGVVRLLEETGKVEVLVKTEDGWEKGRVSIPAGWYAMSLSDDEINKQE
jgi:hypothetical protein